MTSCLRSEEILTQLNFEMRNLVGKLGKFAFSKGFGKSVYIVASKRTPIARYAGAYKSINAPDLGAHAIEACLGGLGLEGGI